MTAPMNILMFSTDREIFTEGSAVRCRMSEYGQCAAELHIIIFARRRAFGFQRIQIAENVWAYSTNSRSRWLYVFDAVRIGRGIIENCKLPARRSPRLAEAISEAQVGAGGKIENSRNDFIVTSQDPFEVGLAAWRVARKKKCTLQLQIHTDVFSPYFARESVFNRIRVLFARFLLPKADCVRVVSERIKHSLIERRLVPESRISVLPVFVDTESIRAMPVIVDLHKKYPQFERIVLMASRLNREKNIGLAVAVMASVVLKHPKIGLIIVGNGPEREGLEKEVRARGLSTHIIFEGTVEFQTLVSYYKTADLFLLTSNYEGYGRTIVEALVVGLPIVMTDVGIAREIKRSEAYNMVVPVGDTSLLIQKVIISLEKHREPGRNHHYALMQFIDKSAYLAKYQKTLICHYDKH